ncbi:MAG: SBBP repeat-containing protein [Gammaproteobacteria bacterium]|nr:SBBP repeat-containing protein [Gammaproteobacteria bacterium]
MISLTANAGTRPTIQWSIAFNTDSTAHSFGAVHYSESEPDIVFMAGAGDFYAIGHEFPDPSIYPQTKMLPEGVDLSNAVPGEDDGIWVAKINYRTNEIVFFTFIVLGKAATHPVVSDMAIDASGDIFLVGHTTVTPQAVPPFPQVNPVAGCGGSRNGQPSMDGLVAKVSADGQQLKLLCPYGGTRDDYLTAVDTFPNGLFVVAGYTNSQDAPTSVGYPTQLNGSQDGFFAVHLGEQTNHALYRAAYFGGSGEDAILDVLVVGTNTLYLGGISNSIDIATTTDAIGISPRGELDQILVRIDPETGEPVYTSYLGGSGNEDIQAMAADPQGNLYLVGTSNSLDYPTVGQNAIAPISSTGAVVTKLDRNLRNVIFSSYHATATANFTSGEAIAVNSYGDIAIGGQHEDPMFYPAINPLTNLDDGAANTDRENAHVIKWLNVNGAYALDYATHLGSQGRVLGLDLDDRENLLIGGEVVLNPYIDTKYHFEPFPGFPNASMGPFAMVITNDVPTTGNPPTGGGGGGGGGGAVGLWLLVGLALLLIGGHGRPQWLLRIASL